MEIQCLGINHHSAEVCLRERLAFSEEQAKAALASWRCRDCPPSSINEMILLSTCNRVELYAVMAKPGFEPLEQVLSASKSVALETLEPHFYRLSGEAAVEHLLRVAAGLDSLVIGEPQILGQVQRALELGRSQGAVGPVLLHLFQAAIQTGKRARTETEISQNPASISSLAVRVAEQAVNGLEGKAVGVLGAGEMAELALDALRKRGVQNVTIINRSLGHAQHLADRWQGQVAAFDSFDRVLAELDILICSTGAPHTLIGAELIAEAMSHRPKRPLVLLDIAVPRDVEAAVGLLPGVTLLDMDGLERRLQASLEGRRREIPQVETILGEEKERFLRYLETLEVLPIIAEMRQRAEQIRQAELARTLRRMGDLSDEDRQHLEALTEALVKKLLHEPITRLRSEAGSPSAARYASAARRLFGLEP